jgi:hypothetical protein
MADTLAQRASSRRGTSNDGVTSGGGVLRRDAHLWGVPTRVAVAVALTPVVVAVAMFLLADAQQTFFWLSDEDHPIEWLQFALLVPAIVAFAATALKLSRLRYNAAATVTAGLTLGLFFIAGEEISWGQRILGFGTPSSLQGTNYQDEATLHNIGGLHQYFVHGVALIGFYGAVAPLLWYAVRSRRARTPLTCSWSRRSFSRPPSQSRSCIGESASCLRRRIATRATLDRSSSTQRRPSCASISASSSSPCCICASSIGP